MFCQILSVLEEIVVLWFLSDSLMECYVDKIKTNRDITTDIKLLIPDAALRRRMSHIVKTAVATAVECLDGVDTISSLDAIITATGWGCLEDSERFLRNFIVNNEKLLNPTPFIQSTFNTVGSQIALLKHNHCYNVTFVNRSHSFEDALLDAMMHIADGASNRILLGAFDEQTPSQHRIMERMGLFRNIQDGAGVVFTLITAQKSERSIARVTAIDFPNHGLTESECMKYASSDNAILLYNVFSRYGLFPIASAFCFAEAIDLIRQCKQEVIVYNEYLGATPTIVRLQCIG